MAPDCSIEAELLKPSRTSRVTIAEFSQPLCTAVQIALVDTLESLQIRPHAVVGHSSGEIAAAYAAKGLTAKEAIAIAYHRGASTKNHTEPGGMAAVGLGWEEAQRFLVPGVVTACDNSPSSVTLSGDAERLATVVAGIKASHPNVPATMLKVDKAYHSHHMSALGKAYFQAMIDSGVVGKPPSLPFFSSVTGGIFGNQKGNDLGPKYWQTNLESPVLFKSAVSALLESHNFPNEIVLELGPHSALAGPLRQILASHRARLHMLLVSCEERMPWRRYYTPSEASSGSMWSLISRRSCRLAVVLPTCLATHGTTKDGYGLSPVYQKSGESWRTGTMIYWAPTGHQSSRKLQYRTGMAKSHAGRECAVVARPSSWRELHFLPCRIYCYGG